MERHGWLRAARGRALRRPATSRRGRRSALARSFAPGRAGRSRTRGGGTAPVKLLGRFRPARPTLAWDEALAAPPELTPWSLLGRGVLDHVGSTAAGDRRTREAGLHRRAVGEIIGAGPDPEAVMRWLASPDPPPDSARCGGLTWDRGGTTGRRPVVYVVLFVARAVDGLRVSGGRSPILWGRVVAPLVGPSVPAGQPRAARAGNLERHERGVLLHLRSGLDGSWLRQALPAYSLGRDRGDERSARARAPRLDEGVGSQRPISRPWRSAGTYARAAGTLASRSRAAKSAG